METFVGVILFFSFVVFSAWCKFQYEKMVVKEAIRDLSDSTNNH